jgi:hypothetical protein
MPSSKSVLLVRFNGPTSFGLVVCSDLPNRPATVVYRRSFRHLACALFLVLGFIGSPHVAIAQGDCVDPGASGVTLCGEADLWMAANPGALIRAFDEYYPGLESGSGCLSGQPGEPGTPPVLDVGTGTVEVRAYDASGIDVCALQDGSSTSGQVSDAWIEAGGSVELVFDPPTIAFFTYFGSLASGQTAKLQLFDDDNHLVDSFSSFTSTNNVDAKGYGFWSDVPIRRIRFTSSEIGPTLVGAFVRLATNTPIPGPRRGRWRRNHRARFRCSAG